MSTSQTRHKVDTNSTRTVNPQTSVLTTSPKSNADSRGESNAEIKRKIQCWTKRQECVKRVVIPLGGVEPHRMTTPPQELLQNSPGPSKEVLGEMMNLLSNPRTPEEKKTRFKPLLDLSNPRTPEERKTDPNQVLNQAPNSQLIGESSAEPSVKTKRWI